MIWERQIADPFSAGLEQLRALAISYVIAVHTLDRWFPGGGVGVFFALSGYLTTAKLLACGRVGWREVAAFGVSRATRLYPAFLVVMAGIGAALVTTLPERIPDFLASCALGAFGHRGRNPVVVEGGGPVLPAAATQPVAAGHQPGPGRDIAGLEASSTVMAMVGLYEPRGEGVAYYGFGMAAGSLLAWMEKSRPQWLQASFWRWGWPVGYAVLAVLLFVPQLGPRIWWLELSATVLATCAVMRR